MYVVQTFESMDEMLKCGYSLKAAEHYFKLAI